MGVNYQQDFSQPAIPSKYLYELQALGEDMAKNSAQAGPGGLSKFLVDGATKAVSSAVGSVKQAITPKRSTPSGPK